MKYEVVIYWSDADDALVADVTDLPGCMALGPIQVSALRSAHEATEVWFETARQFSHPVPEPRRRRPVLV